MPGSMGRRRSTHHGLPPHMARKGEAYYYVGNGKPRRWLPLGTDLAKALVEWARLEGEPVPTSATTLTEIAAFYRRDILPRKAISTQSDNKRELAKLEAVFGASPLATIRPTDVARYLAERMDEKGRPAPVRANREVALLSHVINYARERGLVDMANPCLGIRKHREPGRDRYIEDAEFIAIYDAGDDILRDAMDLMLATSQRPSDVIRFRRADVKDGALWVRQGKTRARLRIAVEGELAAAIERMKARERDADSVYLIADKKGQPVNYWQLADRFEAARKVAAKEIPTVRTIQMRDIRSKAATDVESLEHAQALLGHASRAMTEHYIKQRPGATVKPHSRRKL